MFELKLKTWLDQIEDWTNIKEWVKENGTDKDKEFIKLVGIACNSDQTLVTMKYKEVPSRSSAWSDYDGKLRECRGITFDTVNHVCVIHPFDKFFEIDQTDETSMERVCRLIEDADTLEFTEKLDGSMIAMRYYKNQLIVTSMSRSESDFIETVKKDITKEIEGMCKEYPNYTFIFEELEEENNHVVMYQPEELGLYLIGYRDMTTNETASYQDMARIADASHVRHTKIYNTTLEEQIRVLNETSGFDREGCVINIDGFRVKLKSEDYKALHYTITSIGRNELIERVANGTISEIEDILTEKNKQYVEYLNEYIKKYNEILDEYIKLADNTPDKRVFFTEVLKTIPESYRACVTAYYRYHIRWNPLVKSQFKNNTVYKKDKELIF